MVNKMGRSVAVSFCQAHLAVLFCGKCSEARSARRSGLHQ